MKITFVPTRLRRSGQSNGNRKRGTPRQLFGGRIRLSTVVLMVAFLAVWWLYDTYNPQHSAGKTTPPSQVVPPGFVPDPNYTWVPRTRVQPPTTATRPTPTTTSPTPTPTRQLRFPAPRRRRVCCRRRSVPPLRPRQHRFRHRHRPLSRSRGRYRRGRLRHHRPANFRLQAKRTATLACRDDHPGPCQQAVQIVGAPGVG